MTESSDAMNTHSLAYFWNELIDPTGEPVTNGIPLDPTLAETVRQFQTLGATPPPQPVRERLRVHVMASIAAEPLEQNMTSIAIPASFPKANGHRPLAIPDVHPPEHPRPGWVRMASIAAALLIALATVVGLLANGGFDNPFAEQRAPALVPAVQDSHATYWNQYRNGPGHTGVATSPGPEANPTVLWQTQTGAGINSEASVVDGVVYIGSGDGRLYALDASSGKALWTFDAGAAVNSAPTVGNGIVYFTSQNDELIAARTDTGAEVWRFEAANGSASPVLADGTLYLSGNDDSVYALDPATSEQRWVHDIGAPSGRTPAYANDTIYAGTEDGQLIALDATTGDERWRFHGDAGVALSTVVDGNTIYQSIRDSETNALYALDASEGTEKWRFQTASDTAVGIPTVHGNRVYTAADDGQFYALDASNGVVQWAVSGAAPWQADAKLANGVLYIYNPLAETLYAFEADTGAMIWSLEGYAWVGKGPAIVDGVLYAGTDDGVVYAIGEGDQPIVAASPQASASPVVTSAGPGQIELLWSTTGTAEHPLMLPQDIAIAPSGEIYVLDPTENNFSVFSPDGDFIETWGEEGTGPGQFHFYGPNLWIGGIDFDAEGNIYVFDLHNNRIQKFAPDRTFVKEWGVVGDGVGEFVEPEGAVDSVNGLVYVTDTNNRIQVFDLDGNYLDRWGKSGSAPAQFLSPRGVAIDSEGNVFVNEQVGRRIQKFDSAGAVIDTSQTDYPAGKETGMLFYLTIGPDDTLYLPDWEGNRLLIFDKNGTLTDDISEIPGYGKLIAPVDIEFDAEGFAYITLENAGALLKVKLPERS